MFLEGGVVARDVGTDVTWGEDTSDLRDVGTVERSASVTT